MTLTQPNPTVDRTSILPDEAARLRNAEASLLRAADHIDDGEYEEAVELIHICCDDLEEVADNLDRIGGAA